MDMNYLAWFLHVIKTLIAFSKLSILLDELDGLYNYEKFW